MKILLVHNSHRSGSSSGDDSVFKKEAKLLEENGHTINRFNPCNDEIDKGGLIRKITVALQIPWSFNSAKNIRKIVWKEKPDLTHIHNFFPLISPSVYHVLKAAEIPVVQTLHDFRFLCPMAFFMRNESICEECKNGSVFKSIKYGCFKNSIMQTIPVALMLKFHQMLNTLKNNIDGYICLTESQRRIFLDAGFDEERLFVKPNFIEGTYQKRTQRDNGYVVFIGRIGEEKGLRTLIGAWKSLPDMPLKIVGDGPDMAKFRLLAQETNLLNVEFLGYRPYPECMEILNEARFLVMPSVWYETFGLTIIEAFACAKPVIASNLGAMADLITDGETGLLFEPGNPSDLTNKVERLWNNEDEVIRMGGNARKEFEEKYTAETNYKMLMEIYEKAIELHKRSRYET